MSNFQPLEVVGRGSWRQLQVVEILIEKLRDLKRKKSGLLWNSLHFQTYPHHGRAGPMVTKSERSKEAMYCAYKFFFKN